MISVALLTIPEYLRNSELYKTFQERENYDGDDKNNEILIPENCCKLDDSVNLHEDLMHLCQTLRYWGVAKIPPSIYAAAFRDVEFRWDEVVTEFGTELSYLKDLTIIRNQPKESRIKAAISIGSLSLVKLLHEQIGSVINLNASYCSAATSVGNLDILEYFHTNGLPWDEQTTCYGVYYGHLNCVQYAHELGCPWHNDACSIAAGNGHLDCLKYTHEHGCHWTEATAKNAAENGHLDCLQYAHKHGCPWNEETTGNAAKNGHLDCLQYAHEHGCPWDKFTTSYAAKNGHLICLQYAKEHGCP